MVEKIVPAFHPAAKKISPETQISQEEKETLEELDALQEIQQAALEAASAREDMSYASVHHLTDIQNIAAAKNVSATGQV